jgi:hypothetical protein
MNKKGCRLSVTDVLPQSSHEGARLLVAVWETNEIGPHIGYYDHLEAKWLSVHGQILDAIYWAYLPEAMTPVDRRIDGMEKLMRAIGDKGHHVMVRYDPDRLRDKFTVTVKSERMGDTDDPTDLLIGFLNEEDKWRRNDETTD